MYLSSTVLLILLGEFTKADTFGHFGKSTPTYVHFSQVMNEKGPLHECLAHMIKLTLLHSQTAFRATFCGQ